MAHKVRYHIFVKNIAKASIMDNTKKRKNKQAKRPKMQLRQPKSEAGRFAKSVAGQIVQGQKCLNREQKRRIKNAIRSVDPLAEAIREYLPGLLGLLRGFERLDKRIGARYSMAVVLAKLIVGFALRAESNRDAEERIFNEEGLVLR
jgi:hypothetical protein